MNLLSKNPTTSGIYTLSLHDALPISRRSISCRLAKIPIVVAMHVPSAVATRSVGAWHVHRDDDGDFRSEEHTSELQSHSELVCRLLLEKKKLPQRTQRTTDRGANDSI